MNFGQWFSQLLEGLGPCCQCVQSDWHPEHAVQDQCCWGEVHSNLAQLMVVHLATELVVIAHIHFHGLQFHFDPESESPCSG